MPSTVRNDPLAAGQCEAHHSLGLRYGTMGCTGDRCALLTQSFMRRFAVLFASIALAPLLLASDACGYGYPEPTPTVPPTPMNYGHGIPRWTPDSAQIVFEREHSIYVVNVDGTESRQILKGGQDPRYETYASPSVSPDGLRIAYSTTRRGRTVWELETAGLDGSDRRVVARERTPIAHPVWSPDGRRIAYMFGGTALVTMDGDGSNGQVLAVAGGVLGDRERIRPPVWSPNGRYIAFTVTEVVDDAHPETVYRDVIYTVRDGGSELSRAADGVRILESSHRYTTLTISSPAWTPDGLLTYGRSHRQEIAGVYVSNPDGSDQRRIIAGSNAKYVAWSPGGEELTFSTTGVEHNTDRIASCVYAVRIDGSRARALATESLTSWAPDGSMIAFNRWGGVISIAPPGERVLRVLAEPLPEERPAPTPYPYCSDPTHLVITSVN